MPCCGKKVANIVIGNVKNLIGKPNASAKEKMAICEDCEYITWMCGLEYVGFLAKNGLNVVKNKLDLTLIPLLPKQKEDFGRHAYCRLCKCLLAGKTQVKNEKCPFEKW